MDSQPDHRAPSSVTVAFLIGLLIVAMTGIVASPAPAEACSGWIYVNVGHNRVLAPTTPMTIYGDCPEVSYDATIQPYLDVGNRRIAKLRSFDVRRVDMDPQRRTFRIPRRYVRAAKRLGAKSGHRRAVLKFVIRGTIRETGVAFQSAHDNFFVLPR